MFLIERSAALPRSRPRTAGISHPGTNPLGTASGGAFELFPRHLFPGSGDLVQAALAAPFSAGRTWSEATAQPAPPVAGGHGSPTSLGWIESARRRA
jgi:hypothetical protein